MKNEEEKKHAKACFFFLGRVKGWRRRFFPGVSGRRGFFPIIREVDETPFGGPGALGRRGRPGAVHGKIFLKKRGNARLPFTIWQKSVYNNMIQYVEYTGNEEVQRG